MKANVVVFILLTAVMATLAAGYLVMRDHYVGQQLPVLAQVADFTMSDQNAEAFASTSLKGKIWIANFFFSSCEGVCPTVNGSIARFADKVKDSATVEFVSISVDPSRDSVPVLKEYAKKFKADAKRWHFLNGSEEKVNAVLTSLKLGSTEDPMQHTSRLVLIDGAGQVRGYYQGTDDEAFEFLERDLKVLAHSK